MRGSAATHLPLPPTHPSFRARPAPALAATEKSKAKAKAKAQREEEDALDDDALLDLAISSNAQEAANQAHANRYRLGSAPMPNQDRVEAARKVRARLAEAASTRESKVVREAREKKKEEEERLVASGFVRAAPGAYNGPQVASKAKAQAVVERAKAAAATRRAAKHAQEMEKEKSELMSHFA